jgi:hypothetical protein
MKIGEIVHYCLQPGTMNAGTERPAIVTNIEDLEPPQAILLDLMVFPAQRDGLLAFNAVGIQQGQGAGQWHPEHECPKLVPEEEEAPA